MFLVLPLRSEPQSSRRTRSAAFASAANHQLQLPLFSLRALTLAVACALCVAAAALRWRQGEEQNDGTARGHREREQARGHVRGYVVGGAGIFAVR